MVSYEVQESEENRMSYDFIKDGMRISREVWCRRV